jgi:acyl carrier protein
MPETLRIRDRAHRLVVEHLGLDPERLTDDASFIDDLGADSLDVVELSMAVEEEFGVEMPDEAAEKVFNDGTFGDLTGWLEGQRVTA